MTKNEARQLVEIAEFGFNLFKRGSWNARQLEAYIMGAYKTVCRFQEDGGSVRTALFWWSRLDMEEEENHIKFRADIDHCRTKAMEDGE